MTIVCSAGGAGDRRRAVGPFGLILAAVMTVAVAPRAGIAAGCLVDLGDGTVADVCTGYQWEKKTDVPLICLVQGLHCVSTVYVLAGTCTGGYRSACQPNAAAVSTCAAAPAGAWGCSECGLGEGTCETFDPAVTTVWDWINQVNVTNLGGHDDWHVPTTGTALLLDFSEEPTGDPEELYTIVDLGRGVCAGGSGPCIDPLLEPVGVLWPYVTASASPTLGVQAWQTIDWAGGRGFNNVPLIYANFGQVAGHARAVRIIGPDDDGDGVAFGTDNCLAAFNPDQRDSDNSCAEPGADVDHCGDVCDVCPADQFDACDPDQSGGVSIGAGGGSYTTSDGSVEIVVPPGSVATDTSIAVTGGLVTSSFVLTSRPEQTTIVAEFTPAGLTFDPPLTVILRWPDADDNGDVDGTGIAERNLKVWKDGVPYTQQCDQRTVGVFGACTDASGFPPEDCVCDRDANTFTITVDSFSELTLAEVACPAAPADGCIAHQKAVVLVKEAVPGKEKTKVVLRRLATEVAQDDFGDPVSGTTVAAVCLYDQTDGLVGEWRVDRAGDDCGGKPCWKALGERGYKYADKATAADGISKLLAKGGDPDKGAVVVKGKNNATKGQTALPMGIAALLAGHTRATVQVFVDDAACFGGPVPTVKKADATLFKAVAP